MKSTWKQFERPGYKLIDLGRPAFFLIPVKKLRRKIGEKTALQVLQDFLTEEFGAYTDFRIPNFGIWRESAKALVADESRAFKVSFTGKRRIIKLIERLKEIAEAIGEKCIYFEAGEDACLIQPETQTAR
jgi:hypothetical protein